MKVSELTKKEVATYLNLDDPDNLTKEDEMLVNMALMGAKSYVKSYTGMSSEEIDTHEEFAIATLVLCQDAYDNRAFEKQTGKAIKISNANKVVQSILDMHVKNLL